MTFRFRVRVEDVGLDEDLELTSAQGDPEIYWSTVDGDVFATSFVEASALHIAFEDMVNRIAEIAPGSRPVEVDKDLVSIGDIADRVGVSREAVRLWATGERQSEFPREFVRVGSNMRMYDWAVVNRWLRRRLGQGDDYETPTVQEALLLEHALANGLMPFQMAHGHGLLIGAAALPIRMISSQLEHALASTAARIHETYRALDFDVTLGTRAFVGGTVHGPHPRIFDDIVEQDETFEGASPWRYAQ